MAGWLELIEVLADAVEVSTSNLSKKDKKTAYKVLKDTIKGNLQETKVAENNKNFKTSKPLRKSSTLIEESLKTEGQSRARIPEGMTAMRDFEKDPMAKNDNNTSQMTFSQVVNEDKYTIVDIDKVDKGDNKTNKKAHPILESLQGKDDLKKALIYSTIFEKKI